MRNRYCKGCHADVTETMYCHCGDFPLNKVSTEFQEEIICAAIWYKDFDNTQNMPKNLDKGLVICGRRHHNCIFIYWRLTGKPTLREGVVQGFMTSHDRFVNRKEAGEIAFAAGQIEKETDCLFSEDLY